MIDQSIKERFIHELYNGENRKYAQRMINRIEKPYSIIPDAFTNKSIVDIGCCFGDQSYLLQIMGNDVTAHDINPELKNTLQVVSEMSGGFKVEYDFNVIKQNQYDTVFCSSVINLQPNPMDWFLDILGIDFNTLVLIYHDDLSVPMHDGPKMYSPSSELDYESVITKNDLIALLDDRFTVIDKDSYWDEEIAVNGINYRKTMLIVTKNA